MADDTEMVSVAPSNLETNPSSTIEKEPEVSTNIFGLDFIPLGDGESAGNDDNPSESQVRGSELQEKLIESKANASNVNEEGIKKEPVTMDTIVKGAISEEVEGINSQKQEQGEKDVPEVDMEQPGPSEEHDDDDDNDGDDDHDGDDDEDGDDYDEDGEDDDDEEEDGEESKQKDEEIDPYSYTRRDNEFTSEIFKIEIGNLPRKYGFKQFKKLITSRLSIKPVKIKAIPRATHAFVTFRNEAERMKALTSLRGTRWKGKRLVTKLAKALPDPVAAQRAEGMARKRFIEEAAQSNEDAKRTKVAKTEEEKKSIMERLNQSVTPLWDQPYPVQIQIKAKSMVDVLKKLTKQLKNVMEFKGSWVEQESQSRGGLCCELLPCIESPVVDGYRNKCEFTIAEGPDGDKTVGFRVGSYRDGYSGVVEPSECIHISEIAKKVAALFQGYIRRSSLAVYDLCFHTGHWQTLTVRSTQYGESMVVVQFNPQSMTKEAVDKEVNSIKEFFTEGEGKDCNLTSLYAQVNHTRAVGGNAEAPLTLLFGEPCIYEMLCDVKFRISPNAFFQVNTKAAEMMFYKIKEWMGDCENATLLDVCCGTGSIGLSLAKHVARVIGVEIIANAVEDARQNAELNGITNARFVCGKAEDVIVDQVFRKLPRKLPVIGIVDPPRAGLHSTVIQAIRKCQKMDKLIYVSCNPNSAFSNLLDLCRPTSKRIRSWPFRLVKAIPVDLFPHTKHCELVMFFQRDSTPVDAAKYYKFFY
ncbi:tRNA (uracil-5-)-methyltransferase homolog A-like [Actinia tenebrosa]|uniref:tRNA (uracil(54)-C(5))-methyltransferase n=1 Tax=Actinia tenebrosa TaxID=6105 RepID=A0A6P8ITD0_ACTTE|nr:tRNA (uracil-5-)-methyltransferase homolog A-like [Actinia tenebrosa]